MRQAGAALAHRRGTFLLVGGTIIAAFALLLGAFPVGLLRTLVTDRVSSALGATIVIGSITRDRWFSYTPTVSIRDLRIVQPAWAGPGDLLRVRTVSLRVPVFALLTGRFRPERIDVDGGVADLIRTADKRSNWQRDKPDPNASPSLEAPRLGDLRITNTRLRYRDARRGLDVAGPVSLNAPSGLRIVADGRFLGTPAHIEARGGRIAGVGHAAPYPFRLKMASPALTMTANATLAGPLNTRRFAATIHAAAPTLKNLDRAIEAGLFGSQPIDLQAGVRHFGQDWLIDRIGGTMGRSTFSGHATVLKREGRTKLDAAIYATRFDFDDLADDAGLARAAALRARIGPRLIPNTRINLGKLGKTDGRLAFSADRVLTKSGPVVLGLRGIMNLDHRNLTISGIVADLANSGRMTGRVEVDHRQARPELSIDLRVKGAKLARIIGRDDVADAPIESRIQLRGAGDTVREALIYANGKVASGGLGGDIRTTVAAILGQDFGKALGAAIAYPKARVPMRCVIANFHAAGGVLTPDPLALETGLAIGRGSGRVNLDGETIDLTLRGWTARPGKGWIPKPIRIQGTLSKPEFQIGELTERPHKRVRDVLTGVGKLIGRTLGLIRTPAPLPAPPLLDCRAVLAAAMR